MESKWRCLETNRDLERLHLFIPGENKLTCVFSDLFNILIVDNN